MKKRAAAGPATALADLAIPRPAAEGWTFLTNHSHVLLCLFRQPDLRLKDVAVAVGITERMVQRVVADLLAGGYVEVTKVGRCNQYRLNLDRRLRHPLEMHHTIGEVLSLLSSDERRRSAAGRR